MEENWRSAPSFPDFEVSDLGRIRRVAYRSKHGLKHPLPHYLKIDSNGAFHPAHGRSIAVARLIAQAFLPTPKAGMVVRFRDGDRSNRRADNLVWAIRPTLVRGGDGKLFPVGRFQWT